MSDQFDEQARLIAIPPDRSRHPDAPILDERIASALRAARRDGIETAARLFDERAARIAKRMGNYVTGDHPDQKWHDAAVTDAALIREIHAVPSRADPQPAPTLTDDIAALRGEGEP